MGNRKEEILIVALHLFARDGYEAVSVSQIAGRASDMTKGHYTDTTKSKRDILTVLLPLSNRMANRHQIMICRKMKKESMPEEYEVRIIG